MKDRNHAGGVPRDRAGELDWAGRAAPFYAPPYGPAWTCKGFHRVSLICELGPAAIKTLLAGTPFVASGDRVEVFHDDLSGHSLGAFNESGVCVPVSYEGYRAIYHAVMFVSSDVAMIAGREVFGYPKLIADVQYSKPGRNVLTETRRGGHLILRVEFTPDGGTSTVSDMVTAGRDWHENEWEWGRHLMVKSIPRADRPGADIFRVIYRNIRAEPTTIGTGSGTLQVADAPEVAPLRDAKVIAAYELSGDFGAGWGEERIDLGAPHYEVEAPA